MQDKNIVFMGTPDFAVPILEMLIENCHVVMVVTKPDKEVGRKHEVVLSPVKKVALEHNIPVFQPIKIRNDYEALANLDIDLIVTCAYGQIIPESVLDMPKYGCVNVHASLLPKYRGSAPIQWALFNGETETGVTIMYMDAGMDTGDIINEYKLKINDTDNVGTLHEKLSLLGKDALLDNLPSILNGSAKRTKQGDNYTLAPMIKREDERLDFDQNGLRIINKIRGLNPWPLANIVIDGKELKIIEAEFKEEKARNAGTIVKINKKELGIACQDGIIYLKKVKPSGKKEMTIENYLNGINKEKYLGMVINNGEK